MEQKGKCRAKVPDHTDTIACGAPVVRMERCAEHILEEVLLLNKENDELLEQWAKNTAKISELLGKKSSEKSNG